MLLTARDAILEDVCSVAAETCPGGTPGLRSGAPGFAVFQGSAPALEQGRFLGFIPVEKALRNSSTPFGSLVSSPPSEPAAGETCVEELLWRIPWEATVVVPVFEGPVFLGIITTRSLLDALLRSNTDLQESLRLYRKSVLKDRRRRADTERRGKEINNAFRKLIELLARPAGGDLFQKGIETLAVLLDATYGAVVVRDDNAQLRETIFTGVTPGEGKDMKTFLQHRRPLVDQVIGGQTDLLVPNAPQYLNEAGIRLGHPTFHSFLGTPIVRDKECFGCIYLCDKGGGHPFTDEDKELAAGFARALALVFSQARERTQRRRAEQEREVLSSLGLQLSGAETLAKIGSTVTQACGRLLPWQSYALHIRRSGLNRYDVVARGTQDGSELRPEPAALALAGGELERVALGEALLLGDPGTRMLAPVHGEHGVVAVLELGCRGDAVYREADLRFLQRLADGIAPAIERAYAESRTAAFLTLASELTMVTTPEEAARTIVQTADRLLGWDSCSVTLYYPELGVGVSVLHIDTVDGEKADVFGPYPIGVPSVIAQRTMDEGPQLILRGSDEEQRSGLQSFGDVSRISASLLFVPLRMGSRSTGVFAIQSYSRSAYTQKDLELLQALADLCAGALERTRLAQGFLELPGPVGPTGKTQKMQPSRRRRAGKSAAEN